MVHGQRFRARTFRASVACPFFVRSGPAGWQESIDARKYWLAWMQKMGDAPMAARASVNLCASTDAHQISDMVLAKIGWLSAVAGAILTAIGAAGSQLDGKPSSAVTSAPWPGKRGIAAGVALEHQVGVLQSQLGMARERLICDRFANNENRASWASHGWTECPRAGGMA